MKSIYDKIAGLISQALVAEMADMRRTELHGLNLQVDVENQLSFLREKIFNLHNSRMTIEAVGAGYAGADHDERAAGPQVCHANDVKVEPSKPEGLSKMIDELLARNAARKMDSGANPFEKIIEEMIADTVANGMSIRKIDPKQFREMFPEPDPRVPPAENKAERAAYDAALTKAKDDTEGTAAGASVCGGGVNSRAVEQEKKDA